MSNTLKLMGEFKKITGVVPQLDGMMSLLTNTHVVDIFKLDEDLATSDSEYNDTECTFQGKPGYSMRMYVKERFGDTALSIVESFINDIKPKT